MNKRAATTRRSAWTSLADRLRRGRRNGERLTAGHDRDEALWYC